jgi:general secretion pathway protein I
MRSEPVRSEGFTLLEAMVALVIVSLGMLAVNSQLNRYAVAASVIEEKTMASWIATNVITELGLQPTWPEIGEREDEIEFGGREWEYRIAISGTDVENLRRVDVEVMLAAAPDRVVHRVSGLLEPPAPRGFVAPTWFTPGGGEPQLGDPGGRPDVPERESDVEPPRPLGRARGEIGERE